METLGTFKDVATANKAVEGLIQEGFGEERITSLTSAPYPDGVIVKTGQRTWFRWMSLGGGLFGAFAGFLLAAGTAYLYPVQTGDKPIVALFPAGIITYELTMLFAILGAIVGMFIEMKLPPWKERIYDASIGEGFIGISVVTASESDGGRAASVMRDAGAIRTKSEGEGQ
jgi:Alternative complex III, ActD subunit